MADNQVSQAPTDESPASGDGAHEFTSPDGRRWVHTTATGAHVEFHRPDGTTHAATIGYDPENRPDEETIAAEAARFLELTDGIRSQLSDVDIDRLVSTLEEAGIFRTIAEQATAAGWETLAINVTPDDDDPDGFTPDEQQAMGEVIERRVREKMPEVVTSITESAEYRRELASDILTHAWAWAFMQMRETHPDAETIPDDEWDALVTDEYRNGAYVTQAMLSFTPRAIGSLIEMAAKTLEDPDDPEGKRVAPWLEEAARKAIRGRRRAVVQIHPQVFNGDGLGHMLSDGTSFHIWRSMYAQDEWRRDDAGRPVITYQGRGVKGGLSFDAEHVSIAAALDAVNKLGGVAPDAFLAVAMLAFQRRHENRLWDDPVLYVTTHTLLDALGYQKHNGAYRRADRQEVAQAVNQLWSLWVWGTRTDKRGKSRPYSGPVLVIKDVEPLAGARLGSAQPITPADTEHIGAWRLYLGSWADDILAEKDPWSAVIMRQLMSYSRKHQRYVRRLGFVLSIAFRIRMHEGTWEQPITVADLLRDAAIPIDTKRPGRTLERFTEALETLAADGIIGTPRYADGRPISDAPTDRTKGWQQRWLESRVIVPPPAKVRAIYEESKQRKQRRRSRPAPPGHGARLPGDHLRSMPAGHLAGDRRESG